MNIKCSGFLIFLCETGDKTNVQAQRNHLENLSRMISYCENITDCRRALQLHYFGEIFDVELCRFEIIVIFLDKKNSFEEILDFNALFCFLQIQE